MASTRLEPDTVFRRQGFKTGFLKLAILKLVSGGPAHGYALIREIGRLTEEDWRPSPGSIYPALRELEEEGLVARRPEGRRKVYTLTPEGGVALREGLEYVEDAMRHLQRLLAL